MIGCVLGMIFGAFTMVSGIVYSIMAILGKV